MSETVILPVVHQKNGVVYADSRDVARAFARAHGHVLESIKNLPITEEFRSRNFRPFKIKDLAGENIHHTEMTKSGFMILVFTFTTEIANKIKQAWIEQFETMERYIANQNFTPEKKKELRKQTKPVRNIATSTWKEGGAKTPADYASLTNSQYKGQGLVSAATICVTYGYEPGTNARDVLCEHDPLKLASVSFGEANSSKRIKTLGLQGVGAMSDSEELCGRIAAYAAELSLRENVSQFAVPSSTLLIEGTSQLP